MLTGNLKIFNNRILIIIYILILQWAPPNSSSSMNVLYPPLLSPGTYPGAATYSFTADFRPPGTSQTMGPMLEPMKLSPTPPQRPYYSPNMSYIPQKSPSYNQVSKIEFKFFDVTKF